MHPSGEIENRVADYEDLLDDITDASSVNTHAPSIDSPLHNPELYKEAKNQGLIEQELSEIEPNEYQLLYKQVYEMQQGIIIYVKELIWYALSFVALIISFSAFSCSVNDHRYLEINFDVPESIQIALLTSTTIALLGILQSITNGLFSGIKAPKKTSKLDKSRGKDRDE